MKFHVPADTGSNWPNLIESLGTEELISIILHNNRGMNIKPNQTEKTGKKIGVCSHAGRASVEKANFPA